MAGAVAKSAGGGRRRRRLRVRLDPQARQQLVHVLLEVGLLATHLVGPGWVTLLRQLALERRGRLVGLVDIVAAGACPARVAYAVGSQVVATIPQLVVAGRQSIESQVGLPNRGHR